MRKSPEPAGQNPALWLADGFNILHACLLKGREHARWWTSAHQLKVARWLQEFAKFNELWLVFDAKRPESERLGQSGLSAQLHFAPSADNYIVEVCKHQASSRTITVITADRPLRDRCRRHDARLMRPWEFAALRARLVSV